MKRSVFFVSDGTGITAETLGQTLLTQFDQVTFQRRTVPFVDSVEKAALAVETINRASLDDGQRAIVFATLTDPKVAAEIANANALVLDLFNVFIQPLEMELQQSSSHSAGRSHGIADPKTYSVRMEAVNFALRHDDGLRTEQHGEADVILIGASRTGKTPTCLYLAMQFGIRAANYPLIPEDIGADSGLPPVLRQNRDRLFGLTIDPERLHQIRAQRRPNSRYASLAQCREEVRAIEALLRRNGLKHINTTAVSIEEISSRILQEMGLERRLF